MKTITITINISEEVQKPTIASSILEQIKQFKLEKADAQKQISKRVNELFDIRKQVMNELNSSVGADVWFIKEGREKEYYPNISRKHLEFNSHSRAFSVTLGFRDGVYKNTPHNDWDIHIQTPLLDKEVLGDMEYRKPKLDEVEIYLVRTNENERVDYKKAYKINSLEEVHKYLEKYYFTYFLQQSK